MTEKSYKRWRLLLGKDVDELYLQQIADGSEQLDGDTMLEIEVNHLVTDSSQLEMGTGQSEIDSSQSSINLNQSDIEIDNILEQKQIVGGWEQLNDDTMLGIEGNHLATDCSQSKMNAEQLETDSSQSKMNAEQLETDSSQSEINLNQSEIEIDNALEFLYDGAGSEAGNQPPSYEIVKWLADIQRMFEKDIVEILHTDALNYKDMKAMILEPEVLETIEPNVNVLETLLQLKNLIDDSNIDVVRQYIAKVVKVVEEELQVAFKHGLQGIVNKRQHTSIASFENFDFLKTIETNLKNYDLERKKVIADNFYFWANQNKVNNWNIIIDIDQSGSMCESIIYSSVIASILASVKSLNTQTIAFSTEVVNLSQELKNNPVDILLATQLTGGTDINKSVKYCQQLITEPTKTMFFLISDLEEGGDVTKLKDNIREIKSSGATVIVLLAITKRGKPEYNKSLARTINSYGIPVLAISPKYLPQLIKKVINNEDISNLSGMYVDDLN